MAYNIQTAPVDATQDYYQNLIKNSSAMNTAEGQVNKLYDPAVTGANAQAMLDPQYQQAYARMLAQAQAKQTAQGGWGLRGQVAQNQVMNTLAPQMASQIGGYQLQSQQAKERALSNLYSNQYGAIQQGATGAYSPQSFGQWDSPQQQSQQPSTQGMPAYNAGSYTTSNISGLPNWAQQYTGMAQMGTVKSPQASTYQAPTQQQTAQQQTYQAPTSVSPFWSQTWRG